MKSPSPPTETESPDTEAAVEGRPSFALWRLAALLAAIVGLGLWQGWALVIVILSILTMIFLHELGHFVMARRAGMKVTEFFIGFGPRIWSFRRGEVEFGVKAIPAGAYVRIIGMSDLDVLDPADESRAYRQKSYPQRLGVAVAGSTMHFLIAILLLFVVFAAFGVTDANRWVAGAPAPDSAAALGGIRRGDKILAIDGVKVATFDEMARQAQRHPEETVAVRVTRGSAVRTMDIRFGARAFVLGTVGEDMSLGALNKSITVNSVADGSLQRAAGLRNGDAIVSINAVALTSLEQLRSITSASDSGMLRIVAVRDGRPITASVDLGARVSATAPTGFLGIGYDLPRERLSPISAAGRSVTSFGQQIKMSVLGVGQLFSPANLTRFASSVISGEETSTTPATARDTAEQRIKKDSARPVSIIGVVNIGEQLTSDIATFLVFLAGINIVIGVINLIPLPPFDGGHVMIATYERLREMIRGDGRRYLADSRKILPLAYGVLLLMVTVGLLATFADITQPLKI